MHCERIVNLHLGWVLLVMVLSGCASTDIAVPEVSAQEQARALQEIRSTPAFEPREVTIEETEETLTRVYRRIDPVAQRYCANLGEDNCEWQVRVEDEDVFNAYAADDDTVVLFRGLFSHLESDDQVAFVLAHELAHHMNGHHDEDTVNVTTGAVLGGLLMGALAAYTYDPYDPDAGQQAVDLIEFGAQLGGATGSRVFSVDQEKESDFVAAHIVAAAGYDLDKARGLMLIMAKMDQQESTSWLASHPAGPERLATFDRMRTMSADEYATVIRTLGIDPGFRPLTATGERAYALTDSPSVPSDLDREVQALAVESIVQGLDCASYALVADDLERQTYAVHCDGQAPLTLVCVGTRCQLNRTNP